MSGLALFFLGPPRINHDGEPVQLNQRKALALLAYLALTDQEHRRDKLAALLWPHHDQQRARANLRYTLWLLKQALPGDWLWVEPESLSLNPQAKITIDVSQFKKLLAACPAHTGETDHLCLVCEARLVEALGLYQDDFLTGFSLPDSAEFEEWQFFEGEHLRQRLAAALKKLTGYYQGQAQWKAAIEYARRWLSLDPLYEPAHRQLMRLYAESGQQAAALRQYQLCIDTLKTELGVFPAVETLELYERLRNGALSPGGGERGNKGPPVPPAPIITLSPRYNLPTQTTPFLGRETELAQLAQLLTAPDIRLVTILGPGGMGKTRLALELAATQLDRFEHGVYFVRLEPLESPESIIPTIAEALHFSFYDSSSPEQQLHNYLRQKQALLVMDNYEHLLDPPGGRKGGAEVAVELLKAASGLKILVTSRARLNIREEQSYSISGIDSPGEALAGEIEQFSAVKLFLESARRIRPYFALTAGDIPFIAYICRLVEGMPLGLILAASWVETLSLAEIANELGRSLDFLEGNWRDLPKRQQSLRVVFDHSWRLLTTQEQAVSQQMSIFRGGFSREAAEVITGASLPILRALMNKSLLQRTPTGRYEIHELLRQYAAEKLEQTAEVSKTSAVSEVRNRHSTYYCTFLQRQEPDLKGARHQAALAEIGVDSENIRTAWNWAVIQGQVERLEQALEGLGLFYEWRGRFQEGETAYQEAVEKLIAITSRSKQETSEGHELRILARLLRWQSSFSHTLGHSERTEHLLQQSLSLLDHPELAAQDTRSERARSLWQMGDIARSIPREGARQHLEESLVLYQSLGDREGIAGTLDSLSNVAIFEGQIEEGERLARESLVIYREIGNPNYIASGLHFLGMTLLFSGRYVEIHTLLEESIAIYSYGRAVHDHLTEAQITLGWAKVMMGRYKEARLLGYETLRLAREIGHQYKVGSAFRLLGWVALAEAAYPEAQQFLQESIAIHRELGKPGEWSLTAASLSCAIRGLGHISQAQQHLYETLQLTLEIKSFPALILTLPALALVLIDQEKPEQAIEIYALASQRPQVANSCWFEDVAGRHITAVARTLPLEVVAAAQARGRARNLWATAQELLVEMEGGENRASDQLSDHFLCSSSE